MIELTIKILDEDLSITERFVHYDSPIVLSRDDPTLQKMVNDTMAKFNGTLQNPDIIVKTKMTW